MTGVETIATRGEAPAISLLNPNENLGGWGTSGFIFGSYCGPGVPFRRFSGGNFQDNRLLNTLDSRPILTVGDLGLLTLSAS